MGQVDSTLAPGSNFNGGSGGTGDKYPPDPTPSQEAATLPAPLWPQAPGHLTPGARVSTPTGGIMNTVKPPSHLSGPVGVNCPTCRAIPGYPCRNRQGRPTRIHRTRQDKARGKLN